MKKRLLRVAKWVAYPLFYLFCLAMFGYLTFPFDQLKTRVIAEFDRMQSKSKRRGPPGDPVRLEIAELDGYWLTGLEVSGARLTIPAKKAGAGARAASFGARGIKKSAPEEEPQPSVLVIDHASARVRILPLLIGNVVIDFTAETLGGEIHGTVPYGQGGDVEVDFEGLQLIDVGPLQALLQGVPLQGVASGALQLTPKDGKFGKADGRLSVTIDTVKLGKVSKSEEDGQPKDVVEIQGVEMPSVQVGQIVVEAKVKDGLLTFEEFGAQGRDFELHGDGKVKLHESWERAQADFFIKFTFSEEYRNKSDAASSLLGKPGDKFPPAIEVAPRSPFKKAKTEDGYYRFHVIGALGDVDFKPAGKDAAPRGSRARRPAKTGSAPFGKVRPKVIAKPKPSKDGEEDEDADNGRRPGLLLPRPPSRSQPAESDEPPPGSDAPGADAPGSDAPGADAPGADGSGEAEPEPGSEDEAQAPAPDGDDGSESK